MALNGLYYADVPLSNYSLTHFVVLYDCLQWCYRNLFWAAGEP